MGMAIMRCLLLLCAMILSTAGTSFAEECQPSTLLKYRNLVGALERLAKFRIGLLDFQENNNRLPQSKEELYEWVSTPGKGPHIELQGDDSQLQELAILQYWSFLLPEAYSYGYRFTLTDDWSLLGEPPSGWDIPWIKLRSDGTYLSGPGPDSMKELPASRRERVDPIEDGIISDEWTKKFGTELHDLEDFGILFSISELASLQSIASARPDLARSIVNARGMIDPAKVFSGHRKLGNPEPTRNKEVRPLPDGWQVVIWPKAYGPEARYTFCQDHQGNIRVGDVGGSDDCSKVPCL